MPGAKKLPIMRRGRMPLAQIEATVAAHLGPGRVRGNERGPCFSRQISMYLAKNVAGWSTSKIGRFYDGRHHTTVLHAIDKIDRLRKENTSVEALLDIVAGALCADVEVQTGSAEHSRWHDTFAEMVAARVIDRLESTLAARAKAITPDLK